jgi:nucleoside-diphosphate-sugar epimerase
VAGRRVLVTGGVGKVAAQLIPGLQERYEVRLVDRATGDDGGGDVPLVVGELTDRPVLDRALEGVDSVVHLAGNPDPGASWPELQEPNVEGFEALLAASEEHGVRRVVFASSVHAMGAYEGLRQWPIDPAWPPFPCCKYGATKAFDEALARMYAYRSGMVLIGLRFGLCTPQASPAETVAGWLGTTDLRRVVVGALETDVRLGVYNAVSWPSRHRWNIQPTVRDLGYEPDRDDGPEDDGDQRLITCAAPPAGRLETLTASISSAAGAPA